ncbi:hypothetical protein BC834DRAFT_537459 [Gloeopeniophorella convolvens]|nr:hypothetical protein BC834DRAFT_537459 [Gloeopeniophorella convolvens]
MLLVTPMMSHNPGGSLIAAANVESEKTSRTPRSANLRSASDGWVKRRSSSSSFWVKTWPVNSPSRSAVALKRWPLCRRTVDKGARRDSPYQGCDSKTDFVLTLSFIGVTDKRRAHTTQAPTHPSGSRKREAAQTHMRFFAAQRHIANTTPRPGQDSIV